MSTEDEESTGRRDESGSERDQRRVRIADGGGLSTYRKVALYLMVPGLLALNWAVFRLLGMDYVSWYLANGVVIALGTAFVSRIWESIEGFGPQLVSAHPVTYYGGCAGLAGLWMYSASVAFKSPPSRRERDVPPLRASLDGILSHFVNLAVAGLVLGWILFVAPMNYLVTIVAGAPAREYFRHPSRRTIGLLHWRFADREPMTHWRLEKGTLALYEIGVKGDPELTDEEKEELKRHREIDEGSIVDLTFGRNPFETTQTIAALVLFGVGWLV